MFGDSERRNQALDHIRESLKQDPANLELANRYWGALAGPRRRPKGRASRYRGLSRSRSAVDRRGRFIGAGVPGTV